MHYNTHDLSILNENMPEFPQDYENTDETTQTPDPTSTLDRDRRIAHMLSCQQAAEKAVNGFPAAVKNLHGNRATFFHPTNPVKGTGRASWTWINY